MDSSSNKSKIISLLALYNLDYIVDFPTRMNTQSASAIDNIFWDRSQNKNYSTGPYFNGLSDHDALMLSLSLPSLNQSNYGKAKIG
jgi:hypothetical protein